MDNIHNSAGTVGLPQEVTRTGSEGALGASKEVDSPNIQQQEGTIKDVEEKSGDDRLQPATIPQEMALTANGSESKDMPIQAVAHL